MARCCKIRNNSETGSEGCEMYVNPFWLGVGVTLFVEMVAVIVLAIWIGWRGK